MREEAGGERLKSCTKFITEPNNFVTQAHGRTAVILDAKDFQQREQGDVKDAASFNEASVRRFASETPVSKRVNRSRADDDDAALIDRVGPMTTGYEKSDDQGGPSPKVFLLAVGAVLILLVCGFYLLSR